jgi:hypothetical protein
LYSSNHREKRKKKKKFPYLLTSFYFDLLNFYFVFGQEAKVAGAWHGPPDWRWEVALLHGT